MPKYVLSQHEREQTITRWAVAFGVAVALALYIAAYLLPRPMALVCFVIAVLACYRAHRIIRWATRTLVVTRPPPLRPALGPPAPSRPVGTPAPAWGSRYTDEQWAAATGQQPRTPR